MACTSLGPVEVTGGQDEEYHRTYIATYKVQGTPGVDGPDNALAATGLPAVGTTFKAAMSGTVFTGSIEQDAWCRPTRTVKKLEGGSVGDKPSYWSVEITFSTKPQVRDRCNDTPVGSPLDEYQKVSWNYNNFTEEASYDRFGRRILSSSHEPIHGPNNEWDFTRTTIQIEQNVPTADDDIIEQMKDTVNAISLWGLPERTIKFKPGAKSRHFYKDCLVYFTRTLIFEIKFRRREGMGADEGTGTGTYIELTPIPNGPYETWDRDVWDEGTRAVRGYWSNAAGQVGTGTGGRTHWTLVDIDGAPPDPDNPQHFIRFKDWNGENSRTLLDGQGRPAFVPIIVNQWWVIKVDGSSGLGIPTALSYHKVYLPCRAAIKAAQNADTAFNTVTLHGPYANEAAAQAAITAGSVGAPVTTCTESSSAGVVHIEKYGSSDFRILGIPSDLAVPTRPFEGSF